MEFQQAGKGFGKILCAPINVSPRPSGFPAISRKMEQEEGKSVQELVRNIVSAVTNLQSRRQEGGETTNTSTGFSSVEEEHNARFRFPRQGVISPRGVSCRPNQFNPRNNYSLMPPPSRRRTTSWNKKGKASKDLVYKDVCLLPSPDWNEVPRGRVKAELIGRRLYVDALKLDKNWGEDALYRELFHLFEQHLTCRDIKEPIGFEFVKSSGSSIVPMSLPHGQEKNAKVVKHVSGQGPIYIRALKELTNGYEKDDEDDNEDDNDNYAQKQEDTNGEYDSSDSDSELMVSCFETTSRTAGPSTSARAFSNTGPSTSTRALSNTGQSTSTRAFSNTGPSTSTRAFSNTGPSTSTRAFSITAGPSTSSCGVGLVDTLKEIFPDTSDAKLISVTQSSASLEEAIEMLLQNEQKTDSTPASVRDVLRSIPKTGKILRLTVNRMSLLQDAIASLKQREFQFCETRVIFEGEPAIDAGGVTREFFTLVMKELLSPACPIRLFEGQQGQYLPLHNTDALRSGLFKVAGRIVALSLLNGCCGFPVFSPIVYKYFISPDPYKMTDVARDDVTDHEVLEAINMLDNLTQEELPRVAAQVQPLLIDSGFPHALSLANRHQAVFSLCLHSVILSRKAELDQFIAGLGPVIDLVRKYPEVMKSLFVGGQVKPTTPKEFLDLVVFENVEPEKQEFLQQFLVTEGGKIGDLLMFATGCESIPPMGFFLPSHITVRENSSCLPNANTCSLELELPGLVTNFQEFKEAMNKALENQKSGFGII